MYDLAVGFTFEFDRTNKILLVRVEGEVTDPLLVECYEEIRKYSVATDARIAIFDFSSVTHFAVSSEFIRSLARREPAMPDATRVRILAAEGTVGFGLARMFQLVGEEARPNLKVVRSFAEALAALGITCPLFEPLN